MLQNYTIKPPLHCEITDSHKKTSNRQLCVLSVGKNLADLGPSGKSLATVFRGAARSGNGQAKNETNKQTNNQPDNAANKKQSIKQTIKQANEQ